MHFAQLCYHTICPQNTPSIYPPVAVVVVVVAATERPTDNETLVTFNWHTTGVLYNMHMQSWLVCGRNGRGIECN